MRPLFDFGISQEDPRTEFHLLNLQPCDHVLCVASGGEVPLTLLCLQPKAKITAVDISAPQLMLCRLKLQAAAVLPFPLNGAFLGYTRTEKKWRRQIFVNVLKKKLPPRDQDFWRQNLRAIENGVVNYGRFEVYVKNLRRILGFVIGKKNIKRLLRESTVIAQEYVFDKYIGESVLVQSLFRIAFHPAVYRNRGLKSQALIHAKSKAGQIFFEKFRNFCTATPVNKNYFLQYFLTGNAVREAYPEFLQEPHRTILARHADNITWKVNNLEYEIKNNPRGTFNKIHLSNIGDWMEEGNFDAFLDLLRAQTFGGEKICYRFLQKNHFDNGNGCDKHFEIIPAAVEKTDRFPFYSVLSIQVRHEV